jgi:hypothetical protein
MYCLTAKAMPDSIDTTRAGGMLTVIKSNSLRTIVSVEKLASTILGVVMPNAIKVRKAKTSIYLKESSKKLTLLTC